MTDETRFADETADIGIAVSALLDALARRLPELAPALQDARIVWDQREQVLLVCPVRPDGSNAVLFALPCDTTDPETFGHVSIPVAVTGMYGPEATRH